MSFIPNFLKSFLPTSPYLGIDIGTTSIKIVELDEKNGKIFLKNYGILESFGHLARLNNAIQTSGLKIVEKEAAQLLKTLLERMNIRGGQAIASIPSFFGFISVLEVPKMNPNELAEAMRYKAKFLVPLPAADISVDWSVVGEYEDEKGFKKQQVLLTSIPNDQIKKYQTIFKMSGLSLKMVEIEAVSLARILTMDDSQNSLIVDIGGRSTVLAVAQNGRLKYSNQMDLAANLLTQAIANGLDLNTKRAEELKRQRGLGGIGGEYQLSTLMFTYLDVILNEVERIKNTYEKTYYGKIEKVILSGGGANLIGIEKYTADYLKLPVFKADPFSRISLPEGLSPIGKDIAAPLSVALGLAAKQFISI